jgi:hypothetical protein
VNILAGALAYHYLGPAAGTAVGYLLPSPFERK